jgi:pentatricopeptide repeat protein
MIDAYAKNGQVENAIEVFDAMKYEGIRMNTTLALFKCYAKSGKHLMT